MNKEAQLIKFFVQDLQQDSQSYTGLLDLLKSLNRAILARQVELITSINHQITACTLKLHESSLRREKILQALHLHSQEAGVEQLIAKLPNPLGSSTQTLWQEISQCIIDCKQQNNANGKIMAMHQELITQLLHQADNSGVYNPSYY